MRTFFPSLIPRDCALGRVARYSYAAILKRCDSATRQPRGRETPACASSPSFRPVISDIEEGDSCIRISEWYKNPSGFHGSSRVCVGEERAIATRKVSLYRLVLACGRVWETSGRSRRRRFALMRRNKSYRTAPKRISDTQPCATVPCWLKLFA